jgi:hypothetical protein
MTGGRTVSKVTILRSDGQVLIADKGFAHCLCLYVNSVAWLVSCLMAVRDFIFLCG